MKICRLFILALLCCVGFLSAGSMRVYAFESEDDFYPYTVNHIGVDIHAVDGSFAWYSNDIYIGSGNKYYLTNDNVSNVDFIQVRNLDNEAFTFPYDSDLYDYYFLGSVVSSCDDNSLSTFKPTYIYTAYYDVSSQQALVHPVYNLNVYDIDTERSKGFGFSFKVGFEDVNNIGIRSIMMSGDKDGYGNKPANLIMEFGILAVPIGTDEAAISQQILNKLSEMETSIIGSIDNNTSAINSLGESITSTLADFFGPYFDNITDAFKKALPDTKDSQNEVLSGAMDDYQAAEQVVFSPAMDSLTEFDFESHNISSLGTGFVAAITFVSSCLTNMYDLTPFSVVFGVIATLGLASICIGLSRLWFGKKGK